MLLPRALLVASYTWLIDEPALALLSALAGWAKAAPAARVTAVATTRRDKLWVFMVGSFQEVMYRRGSGAARQGVGVAVTERCGSFHPPERLRLRV